MYGFGHFTQYVQVTCKNVFSCMYTIHEVSHVVGMHKLCNNTWAECMHIKADNGRESTQREQENVAPQILGCDAVYSTVRNSR